MDRPERKRRRYQRRAVRVLVEYVSAAGICREFATTLGGGGMFIETDEPLAPGSRLKVRFSLGGGDPGVAESHEIEGFVAWARRPAHGVTGTAGMGIEFRSRAAVAKLVRALEALAPTEDPPRE